MQKWLKYFLCCVALVLSRSNTYSQENKIDSLFKLLKIAKEDTNKVNNLNAIAWELKYSNPDSTILLANQSAILAHKLNYLDGESTAYGMIGIGSDVKGNYTQALKNYFVALKIDEALGNKNGISRNFGNIGLIYDEQGNHAKALDFYFKALRLGEEVGDKKRIATQLGNIGNVYKDQSDYIKALDYYFKALKIGEELSDKPRIAIYLGNIGVIYYEQGDFTKALDYYLKALSTKQDLGDKNGIEIIMGNLGLVYEKQGDYVQGLDYYFKALKIANDIGDKNGIAIHLGNIGSLYIKTKRLKEAEEYLQKALALDKEIGDKEGIVFCEKNLSALYAITNNSKLAFEHYKLYITYNDSLQNEEDTKKQTRMEMQYDFDKIQIADSIKNAENVKQESFKHEQEIQEQRTYTYGGGIGFLLMVIVAGVSFRAFKQKQKSNEIITLQKHLVEEKQKEILDSIRYAKRIQQSLLPTEKYIEKKLKKIDAVN